MPAPNSKTRADSRHISCQNCRSRKVKCSRTFPCSNCTLRNVDCVWDGALPNAKSTSERRLQETHDEIDRLHQLVSSLRRRLSELEGRPLLPPLPYNYTRQYDPGETHSAASSDAALQLPSPFPSPRTVASALPPHPIGITHGSTFPRPGAWESSPTVPFGPTRHPPHRAPTPSYVLPDLHPERVEWPALSWGWNHSVSDGSGRDSGPGDWEGTKEESRGPGHGRWGQWTG